VRFTNIFIFHTRGTHSPAFRSLLLSLAVLKALATECRRDIALITPALMSCVEAALTNLPSDLEVAARAASVVRHIYISRRNILLNEPQFTSWTTYTDGHLVGADSSFTKDYLSVLRAFSALCCQEGNDKEMRNKCVKHYHCISFSLIFTAVQNSSRWICGVVRRPEFGGTVQ